MYQKYIYFCDEAFTHTNPFYFGAIRLTIDSKDRIYDKLTKLIAEEVYTSEVKWTLLRKHNLEFYKKYIQIFIEERGVAFYYAKINKGYWWHKFARDNNARYYRAFRFFISKFVGNRIEIYLHAISSGNYLNNSAFWWSINSKSPSRPRFPVTNIDAKGSIFISIVDLLLGIHSSEATAEHKLEFRRWVLGCIESRKIPGRFLFDISDITLEMESKVRSE